MLGLECGQISYARLVDQPAQMAAVSNRLPHLGYQSVRNIHGKPAASTPPIERVVRVECAGGADRAVRANATAPPQRERANRYWPHLSNRLHKPGSHALGRFASHARMLIYMHAIIAPLLICMNRVPNGADCRLKQICDQGTGLSAYRRSLRSELLASAVKPNQSTIRKNRKESGDLAKACSPDRILIFHAAAVTHPDHPSSFHVS
jgi:hypothetical protein